jgi:error-prone DNA polymerase
VPEGWTAIGWLRELVRRGVEERYPHGVTEAVARQLAYELDVIEQLDFPSYFLTVHDIVRFARDRGILCQGRGSAANSAACYALGVTAIDPARFSLLFERFISPERNEPPDIDVDFEHERREEVMQYVYERYGRDRAAMVNEIIVYRARSAVRDVGKVFGLSLDQVDRLAGVWSQWSTAVDDPGEQVLRAVGVDPTSHAVRATMRMAAELMGLPRHLGIHSGGFVIAEGDVVDLVPVERATMADRTVVQWDKYGVEGLAFVKVDLLALGMLTAIRKCLDLICSAYGPRWELHTIPAEDPEVYKMFGEADTVGVFQIESRAQQSMLPRLRPSCFYDLVIEVAIVRPGPIQGGMVHPYLRRRTGEEPVTYPHPALEPILERTCGVPLFQEQVMQIAVAIGGFTAGEADGLRRAMGAWRKRGGLDAWGDRLKSGMAARGISEDFAESIFKQILGFGEYGFPESHAASFALLVYASGWLKRYHPEAFCAALINSQPMGFYSPRALVADAQRHGVEVLPVDALHSEWDCTLEPPLPDAPSADLPRAAGPRWRLRLGLRMIRGLSEAAALALVRARAERPFQGLTDLAARSQLDTRSLTLLSDADALRGLATDRRQAAWMLQGLWTDLPLFAAVARHEPPAPLPQETDLEALYADYRTVGLSIDSHPSTFIREALAEEGRPTIPLAELIHQRPGRRVRISGLVQSRQRPGTAKGVVFFSLEDDTGMANLIIWPKVWEAQRATLANATLIVVEGKLQRQDGALSVLVETAERVDHLAPVVTRSRDFR